MWAALTELTNYIPTLALDSSSCVVVNAGEEITFVLAGCAHHARNWRDRMFHYMLARWRLFSNLPIWCQGELFMHCIMYFVDCQSSYVIFYIKPNSFCVLAGWNLLVVFMCLQFGIQQWSHSCYQRSSYKYGQGYYCLCII